MELKSGPLAGISGPLQQELVVLFNRNQGSISAGICTWCKNGRPRTIKIHYPEQWQVIRHVQAFVGKSQRALIPPHKTYIAQETMYDNQLKHACIHHAHGLRHAYAQKRYYDLTGWLCPAQDGPLTKELSEAQRRLDRMARAVISEELGHE